MTLSATLTGVIHYSNHHHTISRRLSGHDYRSVELKKGKNIEKILHEKDGVHSTADFANVAIDKIKNFETTSNDRLFLTLSFNAPHFPYINNVNESDHYAGIEMQPNRRRYLNLITEMDEKIGKIHQELQAKGIWNNTVRLQKQILQQFHL